MDHTRSDQTRIDRHHVTLSLQAVLEGLFKCVACQDSINLPPPHLFRNQQFSVQCPCGMVHEIMIGSRRYARTATSLLGRYRDLANATQGGHMIVEDISFGGIGFRALGSHTIRRGDRLRLEFTLDDEGQSGIALAVWVRNVWEDVIGVEFIPSDDFNCALAAYLIR